MCVREKSAGAVEIAQLAVIAKRQGKGVGTKILQYIETQLAPGKIIEVKTLDESVDYEPFVRTRAFYEKNGFVKVDVIDPYPGWNPGNPCAIYVKAPK